MKQVKGATLALFVAAVLSAAPAQAAPPIGWPCKCHPYRSTAQSFAPLPAVASLGSFWRIFELIKKRAGAT